MAREQKSLATPDIDLKGGFKNTLEKVGMKKYQKQIVDNCDQPQNEISSDYKPRRKREEHPQSTSRRREDVLQVQILSSYLEKGTKTLAKACFVRLFNSAQFLQENSRSFLN